MKAFLLESALFLALAAPLSIACSDTKSGTESSAGVAAPAAATAPAAASAEDRDITLRVKDLIGGDPAVGALGIDIDTRQGVVYMTGSVRSSSEKEKAIHLARGAPGVRDVLADLRIQLG